MRFVVPPIDFFLELPLVFVALDLGCQDIHVFDVVLLPQLLVVERQDVLLLLLPVELLPLELTSLLQLLALLLEAVVCLLVDFLDYTNIFLAFSVSMVVHLEGPLRPEEIRVGTVMVLSRDLLSIEGCSNDLVDI